MWEVEVGDYRTHPDAQCKSDNELLTERVPIWEDHLAVARVALPAESWGRFAEDAIALHGNSGVSWDVVPAASGDTVDRADGA